MDYFNSVHMFTVVGCTWKFRIALVKLELLYSMHAMNPGKCKVIGTVVSDILFLF